MLGSVEIVQLLLGRDNVDTNSKDKWDRTPLLYAAMGGRVEIVQLLLAQDGVDANLKDEDSRKSSTSASRVGVILKADKSPSTKQRSIRVLIARHGSQRT
jgi:ankyrin repeat protein